VTVTDYILNVPEATEFDLLPTETQIFISQLSPEWPDFPMLNTHAVNGRKLLHVRMKAKLIKEQLDQLFSAYALDWQVVSIRSAVKADGVYEVIYPIDKAAFITFLRDIPDGETTRPATIADTIYLSTYAGTDPIEL
jgi:hypothetical protein